MVMLGQECMARRLASSDVLDTLNRGNLILPVTLALSCSAMYHNTKYIIVFSLFSGFHYEYPVNTGSHRLGFKNLPVIPHNKIL